MSECVCDDLLDKGLDAERVISKSSVNQKMYRLIWSSFVCKKVVDADGQGIEGSTGSVPARERGLRVNYHVEGTVLFSILSHTIQQ